ncbi:MAG TPA: outer membrane beta-barrel protein, partial [Nitrosopumilaceae archaeon]|nr:outer membrane beta-barrel protein [Nitrosopumilaceae archaeon]
MKKILSLLIVSLVLSQGMNGQTTPASKNVRFGIKVAPGISWMASDNTAKVMGAGATVKFAIGLQTEFRITDVVSFVTGLDYMTAGGKNSYTGSDTAFYLYKDDAITKTTLSGGSISDPSGSTLLASKDYRLIKRNYKIGYVHIPLSFKMKTKDIGGMTYFGQIGGDLFVRTSAKANDDVEDWSVSGHPALTLTGVDISKQVNIFNAGVNVGGGAEYNISGTTSLFFSLHYVHALLNTTSKTSDYL